MGVSPGAIGGLLALGGKAEVSAGIAVGVVILEGRRLFSAGELHPAQPLQGGEVDHERVVLAGDGLVGQAGKVSLCQALYVLRADRSAFFPRPPSSSLVASFSAVALIRAFLYS